MRANIKTNIKRGIAVGLIAIMAAVGPMQTLQPTGSGTGEPTVAKAAETDKAPYIGEVRLAVDKDANTAKQILEGEGYEVIDQDLNEKAGSFWNDLGDQAVYMGFKRTDDANKAIRDMKTMNMLGKYSFSGLKEKIEQNKKEAKELYKKISAGISEYASNYEAGDIAANTAHKMMNIYMEDDSGKLVGDYMLEKPGEDDLLNLLMQGNTYNVAAIFKALIFGSEESNENGTTWTKRLSKVTSYNALVRKYAMEKYGKEVVAGVEKEDIEKLIASDLDETARVILSKWPEIRKKFTSAPDIEQLVMNLEGEFETQGDVYDMADDMTDFEAVNLAKRIPYGKKTAYDLFTVSSSSFEKNIKNLYPLVFALSPAQRGLIDVADFSDLFQAAQIREAVEDDKSAEKEIIKERDEVGKDIDPISVYEGVDRAMYSDNAAMTSAATAVMEGQGSPNTLMTGYVSLGLIIFSGIFLALGIHYLKSVPDVTDMMIYEVAVKNAQGNLESAIKYYGEVSTNASEAKEALKTAQKDLNKASNTLSLGLVFVALAVVLAAVSVYTFYQTMKADRNRYQLPIPDVLVDFDVENEAGKYVTYHAVKWNRDRDDEKRADRGDLNGDAAKEWLVLYTTTDKTMGEPILADGILAKKGDSSKPSDTEDGAYVPLTMFGQNSIQNLVDETYSFDDAVDGIWVWYRKSGSSEDKVIDDTEDEVKGLSSATEVTSIDDAQTTQSEEAEATDDAELTGSNIGGSNIVLFTFGGVAVGIIAGIFIGFFIRRKKQTVE